MPLCMLKAYLYSISCDPLYMPNKAEQDKLSFLLAQVHVPQEHSTTRNFVTLFNNQLYRPYRWDVWRGIVRALAGLLKNGE